MECIYKVGLGVTFISRALGVGKGSARKRLIKLGIYRYGKPVRRMFSITQKPAKPKIRRPPRILLTKDERRQRANENAKRQWEKRKRDVAHRLVRSQRLRMWKVLRGLTKHGRTMELVGCTPDQLRAYLQAQFVGNMSWNNFGAWEVDHIIPCASFDLSDPKQQRVCFHYTNLRPMWRKANRSKWKHITEPQMRLRLPYEET